VGMRGKDAGRQIIGARMKSGICARIMIVDGIMIVRQDSEGPGHDVTGSRRSYVESG
jgi:hypothetical protein